MDAIPAVSSLEDVKRLRDIIKPNDPNTWDTAWQAKITPWDSEDIQPPLRELIESGEVDLPRKGRALVPGCGSAHDTLYIASALNLDTEGIDISQTAVDRAKQILESKQTLHASKVTLKLGDFFALKDEAFDLVYDYTFFVAIPPSLRPEWGRKMAELIKPGGYLITLIFPIDPPTDVGPPYFVRPEHYADVLGDRFEKVLEKWPPSSAPSHVGKEKIAVWKRV